MTSPTSPSGSGLPVLPPLVARVGRDVLLVLGLGLAVALLRSAAAGADPGGTAVPVPAGPPEVAVERTGPGPVPTLLDDLLVPVATLLAPGADGATAPVPVPPRSTPAATAGADQPSAPPAAPAPVRPAGPMAPPPAGDPALAAPGELLAPVADLLEAVTAPIVPVVVALLEPLGPVLDPLTASLLPDGIAALPPLASPEVERLVPAASPALSVPRPPAPPSPGPSAPLPAAPEPDPLSAISLPRPAGDEVIPDLAPPVDAVPSAPAGDGFGSTTAGANPTPPVAAVPPLIDVPAVVAAGIVVPPSTDGTSTTCPRPGFSPD